MSDVEPRRLRNLTARDIIGALVRDGFELYNQKGSHQRFRHSDGRRVTVTFHHPSDTIAPKTLRSMLHPKARWGAEDLRRLGLLS